MTTVHGNASLPDQPTTEGMPDTLPMELQQLLMQAADQDASDIHLDSGTDRPVIRLRVDGNIYPHRKLDNNEGALRLINQVRVVAEMGIDALWVPEQGQFHWAWKDTALDIRATVAPTAPDNLALHMRLLRPQDQMHGLDELGLCDTNIEQIRKTLSRTDGLVLISGPTGAGKTTTLYAMLASGLLDDKMIATVEDPVEFDLPHVRQLQVNPKHDLTMAECLRTLLRMDPDALAVGEIRDGVSASTTTMAALAGRLAMATIHARDAADAITVLHQMGVPYYIIGHALRMVINQQVIRRLCKACARARQIEASETEIFARHDLRPPDQVHEPTGCPQCHGRGYRGRIGIFHVLNVDRAFGRWLCGGQIPEAIRERINATGSRSIIADGLKKAASGVTSLSEISQHLREAEEDT